MRSFFGHPPGLFICFMTEMWERFSFYGMRAILIYYLTQHFMFSDAVSFAVFGAYASLVYAGPVLGGLIADRYLGFRKAVTLGGILLVLGHFGMAFEGAPATQTLGPDGVMLIERDPFYLQIFYLSLALIVIGVGFLKPNISTIVGALYDEGDTRRDSGFTIFYMGINIGAASASLLCGYLGQTYGWKYGFGLAGVGMLLGLVIFLYGQKYLEGHAEPPEPEALKRRTRIGFNLEWTIYLGSLAAIAVAWLLIQNSHLVGQMLGAFSIVVVAWLLYFSFFRCASIDRDRMLVALLLTIFSVMFWALFEQAGSSLNLFADRNVDRSVFGYEIPASMFQSLNPTFIILLAPLFAALWIWLARRGWEPSTPVKFGLGLVQVGLGFIVLVLGAQFADETAQVMLVWLVLAYLLHTMGELCLSPVGLSMITKLSVQRVVGFMMGVWFLSSAFAHYIAALIAMSTSAETVGGEIVDRAEALHGYLDVFKTIGIWGIATGLLLFAITPILRKKMHGIH